MSSSSSSSDSDSDDLEPIRRIKINIRPKDHSDNSSKAADVSQIKASVDAWRPLGPPTHPSLSKRQSSLSSVSSMSFGAASSAYGSPFGTTNNMAFAITNNNSTLDNQQQIQQQAPFAQEAPFGLLQPSPSCSSLVNEFNNRSSSFSNNNNHSNSFSRTSSPLTITGQTDAIPVAIAIQESIEIIVRSHFDLEKQEPKFETQVLGNIKIAFPNAFARCCSTKSRTNPALRLRMHSVDNIIKYYASGLIKDPTLNTENTSPSFVKLDRNFGFLEETSQTENNSKLIEFDMDKLSSQLKKLYDQSNLSRYYNIDFLRYQVKPILSIEQSPIQICAYWKIEEEIVKLRINFKHSSNCGLSLERFRNITFTVDLSNFIPTGIEVVNSPPTQLHNNNTVGTMNMNQIASSTGARTQMNNNQNASSDSSLNSSSSSNLVHDNRNSSSHHQIPPLLPPPVTLRRSTRGSSYSSGRSTRSDQTASSSGPTLSTVILNAQSLNNDKQDSSLQDLLSTFQVASPALPPVASVATSFTNQQLNNEAISKLTLTQIARNRDAASNQPYVVSEPRASWNNSIKQLTWKFDTLLSYRKTNGMGSLLAKLDFRKCTQVLPSGHLKSCMPTPVDVKFLITDSTLSKATMSVDTNGYRISLLKREIRSGRYRSEPYIIP